MSQFVNYKKRSINLPSGCKDLMHVLKLASRPEEPAPSVAKYPRLVTNEQTSAGGLSDLDIYVAKMFESQALAAMLFVGAPGDGTLLTLLQVGDSAIQAHVTFEKEAVPDQAVQAFFDRHGLRASEPTELPPASDQDSALLHIYEISPLPPQAPLFSKMAADLFRQLCGLDDQSEFRFHLLELTPGA